MTLKDILTITPNLNTNDSIGTDKNTLHCYIDYFYEQEFAKRQNESLNLLEIGINAGGSLYLWAKYFNNATIYGIDISNKVLEQWKSPSNIQYLFENAYTEQMASGLPDFDIIIDDGPHTLESQVDAIKLYLPKLKSGGIFVIEDVQDPSWFDTLIEKTPTEFKDKINIINLTHVRGQHDDLLFVIRKD